MSLFSKIKNEVNTLAIMAMTPTIESKPQSRKALKAKKILTSILTASLMVTMCAVTVFADGGAQLPTFFTEAINTLGTVVLLIGGGIGVWGVINLLEGYSNDNPGAKSQGMKQLMAGVGIALIGLILVPKLGEFMNEQAQGGGGAGA